ncbi:hypothetical protein [Niabella ginsengisoli]|uniref:Uncharacterized protein n=1 Tax=Niabella ginsengisoli TaxID=522298 RepID=A0ABS9SR30_9BACT|nr:hypothetical protein [Niabella ginsengisoli]MCH5600827.1 hypothetical protein [Niabella ginsengisoli]
MALICLLLLSFSFYIQAFHHHHKTNHSVTETGIKKFVSNESSCSICDHIVNRNIGGTPEISVIEIASLPYQIFTYNSYYITIVDDLCLQASTSRGPPSLA